MGFGIPSETLSHFSLSEAQAKAGTDGGGGGSRLERQGFVRLRRWGLGVGLFETGPCM